jgi:hypothetical protein
MVRRLVLTLFFTFVMASCGQPAPPPDPLAIGDVWARDTVGGTANAAVFMTITSPTPDRLLAASAPVAGRTDLMTMQGGSSATEMTYVEGIDLPAGKPVSLNPAGLHVWLADLNQPLEAGQTFPLTLEFERAGQRQVTVSIIEPAAMPPMPGM